MLACGWFACSDMRCPVFFPAISLWVGVLAPQSVYQGGSGPTASSSVSVRTGDSVTDRRASAPVVLAGSESAVKKVR